MFAIMKAAEFIRNMKNEINEPLSTSVDSQASLLKFTTINSDAFPKYRTALVGFIRTLKHLFRELVQRTTIKESKKKARYL